MAAAGMEAALREWIEASEQREHVRLLGCDGGPPVVLRVQFHEYRLTLYADDGCADDCPADGRTQLFVEGEDVDDSEGEEEVARGNWLAQANSFLTDRRLLLGEALGFLLRTMPGRQQGTGRGGNGDEDDYDSEGTAPEDSGDEANSAKSSADGGDMRFEMWCATRKCPADIDVLRERFYAPLSLGVRSESAALQEAKSAETFFAEGRAGPGVVLSCVRDLGLVQLGCDPVQTLCGGSVDLSVQLGLPRRCSLMLALVLSDAALGRYGWQRQGNFAAARFTLTPGTQQTNFMVSDVLPRLVDSFLAWWCGSFGTGALPPSAQWLQDVQASGRLCGNLFVDLWTAILHFTGRCTDFCLICLKRHGVVALGARCSPCQEELCVFRYEEYLASAHADIVRDPTLAEIQLMFASAAAQGKAKTFEPFPPHFLVKREVRTRSGAYSGDVPSGGDEDNKDVAALRKAFSQLPPVEKMTKAASEKDLRDRLGGPNSSAYRLLQFVLATNRLTLRLVKEQELRLHGLPAAFEQLAVLSGAPHAEAAFAERKRRFGSGYAFHGSPLSKWFSIMRNGLQVFSHTDLMANGAACGTGVYMADNLTLASDYCQGYSSGNYSCYIGGLLQCVGVVEYVEDPSCCKHHTRGIITVNDAKALMLRYVLIHSDKGLSSTGYSMRGRPAANVSELDVAEQYSKLLQHIRRQGAGAAESAAGHSDLSFLALDDRAGL